jgi:hypothetical protein
MKEKSSTGQRTLSLNGETECIRFLESEGLIISEMLLSYWERWKLRPKRIFPASYENWDWEADPMIRNYRTREKFINRYGFAVLYRAAIEAMRPYAPLLEIGAGSGYWTYELRKYGVDCIATDTMDGQYGFFEENGEVTSRRWTHHYTHIEILNSVEAVRKYPNRNILTVWPDYGAPWAADALDIFTGQVVIYMGEGHGNATADDRFHELLDERFGDQGAIPMPHFEYSYDRQLLICKKPKQITRGNKQHDSRNTPSVSSM